MNTTNLLSLLSSSSSSSPSSSLSMANNHDLDTTSGIPNNSSSSFDKFGSLSQNYSLLLSQLEKLAINSVLSSTVKPLSTTFQSNNNNNNNDDSSNNNINNNNNNFQQHQNLLQQLQLTQQQLLQQYSGFNNNFNLHNNNNNNGINFHSSFSSSSSSSSSDILNEDTTSIHTITDAEYSRFISDIWIGIVLTLLILSIVFFICSCFLYHKFQQWKNSYRSSNSEPEIIRRCDIDVESLPSYTLVSGLPTYDDAIEQFRKAGILIQQPSVIKIFEDLSTKIKPPLPSDNEFLARDNLTTATTTTTTIRNSNENLNNNRRELITNNDDNTIPDNVSINSYNCNNTEINNSNDCGTSNRTTMTTITGDCGELSRSSTTLTNLSTSIIELNPEQLRMLSQKRLSLQIALNNSNTSASNLRLTSNNNNNYFGGRGKIDLFREISHNNLLRSHDLPQIHRSTSSLNNDERSYDMAKRRLIRNLQHRGSLS